MTHELGSHDLHVTTTIDFQVDSLSSREAAGILEKIRKYRRTGTLDKWKISRGDVFQELSIRTEEGRIATIPLGKSKAIPVTQQVANARFLLEMGNHADWILKAAQYALKHGFKP